jgi:hypothetical protein
MALCIIFRTGISLAQERGAPEGKKEVHTAERRRYLKDYADARKEDLKKSPSALEDHEKDYSASTNQQIGSEYQAAQDHVAGVLERYHTEITEQWEGREAHLSEEQKKRVAGQIQSITRAFDAALQDVQTFAQKMENYLTDSSITNADRAKEKLEIAKKRLTYAEAIYDIGRLYLDSISEADNPGFKLDETREVFVEAKSIFEDARSGLYEVLTDVGSHE